MSLLVLFGLIGGWVGLATAGLQLTTAVVKEAPAVVKDVRQIEAAKRRQVAYLHVDKRTPAQQRAYGTMRWVQ